MFTISLHFLIVNGFCIYLFREERAEGEPKYKSSEILEKLFKKEINYPKEFIINRMLKEIGDKDNLSNELEKANEENSKKGKEFRKQIENMQNQVRECKKQENELIENLFKIFQEQQKIIL